MQAGNLEDREKDLLAEVTKEIEKLKYYLEESNEIIEQEDFVEIKVTHKRTTAIHDKLCNLIAHVQELKINEGLKPRELFVNGKRIQKRDTLRGHCRWERSKTP